AAMLDRHGARVCASCCTRLLLQATVPPMQTAEAIKAASRSVSRRAADGAGDEGRLIVEPPVERTQRVGDARQHEPQLLRLLLQHPQVAIRCAAVSALGLTSARRVAKKSELGPPGAGRGPRPTGGAAASR